ncbi:MAG: hypothetical protein JWN03_4102 [Nocardia sp.]|nr:hypothetical protein [Nocardia sp.]
MCHAWTQGMNVRANLTYSPNARDSSVGDESFLGTRQNVVTHRSALRSSDELPRSGFNDNPFTPARLILCIPMPENRIGDIGR